MIVEAMKRWNVEAMRHHEHLTLQRFNSLTL